MFPGFWGQWVKKARSASELSLSAEGLGFTVKLLTAMHVIRMVLAPIYFVAQVRCAWVAKARTPETVIGPPSTALVDPVENSWFP